MVVRIHNLSKWACLKPGESLPFDGSEHRAIRIEVNCVEPTAFNVVEDDKPTFLAVVSGYEVLEFSAGGSGEPVLLVPTSGGDVWWFTNHGSVDAVESDAVSFATIANRRARNPQLELMMFKLEQNMNRRLSLQAAELDELRALRAEQAAEAGANVETGEIEDEDGSGADTGGGGTDTGAAAGAAELPVKGAAGAA